MILGDLHGICCFLIPIWYLYEWFKLLFFKGDETPNEYGPYLGPKIMNEFQLKAEDDFWNMGRK